jgi:hypothetical protein
VRVIPQALDFGPQLRIVQFMRTILQDPGGAGSTRRETSIRIQSPLSSRMESRTRLSVRRRGMALERDVEIGETAKCRSPKQSLPLYFLHRLESIVTFRCTSVRDHTATETLCPYAVLEQSRISKAEHL